ncbi:MAG: M14 family metallopeptidase [Betaproteobacteria bacterium]
MESIPQHFATTYAEAREGFLAAARGRGLAVESLANPLKGAQGEELATDAVLMGRADAGALLVVTSGTHGAEGFCGSGCQRALLADDDMARRLDAAGVALLLVHAVNPYGFSHLRRVNEDNVDLNRNFRDFSDATELNPAYAGVHGLMLPAEWPPTDANRAEVLATLQKMGPVAFQAAVSAGQRSHKEGLFYCGDAPTWSNRTVRSLLRKHGAARKRIGWIDIHTGLGPYGHGEKIFAGANDAAELARARAWWGADVMSYYEGKSASAEVQGSMVMSIYAECPKAEVTGMGLEFGTVPFEAVLGALRGDHWLAIHPEADAAKAASIRRALRDAFYVEADDWKGSVLGQLRTAVLQAVLGLSAPAPSAGRQA